MLSNKQPDPNDTYLTAIDKQALAPPKDMDAIQIRPDKSWSATVRNRFRPLSIVEWNLPKVYKNGY